MFPAYSTLSKWDRSDLITEIAVSTLGKPWVHQGVGPDAFDCVGLLRYVGIASGIYREDEIEKPSYRRIPNGLELQKRLSKYLRMTGSPIIGCAITVQMKNELLTHVGILTNVGYIHSSLPLKMVVFEPWSERLYNSIRGCYLFERPTV